MASSLTGLDLQDYEDGIRIDNYIWHVYRVTGKKPNRAKVRADIQNGRINIYGTPRDRTAATQAPLRLGITRGLAGFQRRPDNTPRPSNPSVTTRNKRIWALMTTRRVFAIPPRYRFRRLLGRGGQGIALKMTYTPQNNPDAPFDFVLKTGGTMAFNPELRHEARMMEKVKRSAHAVQILHSSGPAYYEDVDPFDSSDDALSSDDEEAFQPRREPRERPTPEQKTAAHKRRWKTYVDKVNRRTWRMNQIKAATGALQPRPPQDPRNPDWKLDINRFDFIFMEYMPLGSLLDTLHRVADAQRPDSPPIPDKILWSFWLCMLRACVAMAFPPRKFHPDRNKGAGDKRPRMQRAVSAVANYNPNELLLEDLPPMRQRGRKKRMVHMDIDAGNMFVGEARDYAYEMKRDVYNDPPTNANPPLRYELGIALEDGLPDEPDTAEHADIPVVKLGDFGLSKIFKPNKRNEFYRNYRPVGKSGYNLPEQFTPDWDFMKLSRDGREVSKEPVAGNYDGHSNIWQMALTMWQLITLLRPPRPPRLTDVTFGTRTIDNTYGILLDHDDFKKTDVNLRRTIASCLKHDPRERPTLDTLLTQAKTAVNIRPRNLQAIHEWVQTYMYNA